MAQGHEYACSSLSNQQALITITCTDHAYTCRELGAKGVKSLLAVPVSFVSEHIETLEEIDMEYRELAHESGIQNWGRVPALNTNPTFIDDLAEAVLEALPYVGSMAGSNPGDAMVPLGTSRTMHDSIMSRVHIYMRTHAAQHQVPGHRLSMTSSSPTSNRCAQLSCTLASNLPVVAHVGSTKRACAVCHYLWER